MKIDEVLRQSRYEAGKSQEYMAFELGIARKTVQNWERGFSEPTIDQAIKWFIALDMSPVPYLYQYIYPNLDNLNSADSDAKLREALIRVIRELPSEEMRQLLYLFYGDHGSSPRAVMNLVTAHLQSPMQSRVAAGTLILKNYELAKKMGQLTDEAHIQPDIELFNHAIDAAEHAVTKKAQAYVVKAKK